MTDTVLQVIIQMAAPLIQEYSVIIIPMIFWAAINWICSVLTALTKSAKPTDPLLKRIVLRSLAIGALNVRNAVMADDEIKKTLSSKKAEAIKNQLL